MTLTPPGRNGPDPAWVSPLPFFYAAVFLCLVGQVVIPPSSDVRRAVIAILGLLTGSAYVLMAISIPQVPVEL